MTTLEKYEDPMIALDALQIQLSCGIKAVNAIHIAMNDSGYDANSFLDALFGAYMYLESLNEEIRDCIDVYFKLERART